MRFIQFIVIFFLFFLIFLPLSAIAQITQNGFEVGIIPGNIWYSPTKFFAGDKIKIYTAIFNNSGLDISGTVIFSDNSQEIGKKDFFLSADEKIKAIFVEWTAQAGNRNISVRLTNLNKIIDGEKKYIQLEDQQIAKANITIDYDNDQDGVGDLIDEDDDNDGIKDDVEKDNNLDPQKNEGEVLKEEFLSKILNNNIVSTSSPLIKQTLLLANKVNSYAEKQKIKLEKIRKEKFYPKPVSTTKTSLHSASSTESKILKKRFLLGPTIDKYLNKLYYFILSFTIFVLSHKLVLYFLLVIIVYNILRMIVRFFLD